MILGVGIDIVDNHRLKQVWDRWGNAFLRRIYSEGEIKYCLSGKAPECCLGARFAAKEAFIKACGTFTSFRDVEVDRSTGGKPSLKLHGGASDKLGTMGVTRCHLSLSHERHFSVAVVVLESQP
ncbi:MAG: holo-ACP synthase [Nitrospirae bacterium]|nr:holo-ACP synthase [Nitrospirota bacterium]